MEEKNKAAAMLIKVKRFYEQAQSRVVSSRAVELSELREKVKKLIDDVKEKDLELQALTALLWRLLCFEKRSLDFGKSLKKGKRCCFRCLQENVLTMEKAIAELLPVAKKARDLQMDAKKKICSLETELSLVKHRETFFTGAINAVNKKPFAAKVARAALRWILDEVLLKLKTLETELWEYLKGVSEWTTDDPSMM